MICCGSVHLIYTQLFFKGIYPSPLPNLAKKSKNSIVGGKSYSSPVSGTDPRSARMGAMLGRPVNVVVSGFVLFLACFFSFFPDFFVLLLSFGFSFPFLFLFFYFLNFLIYLKFKHLIF
jgi:hypothetical protein